MKQEIAASRVTAVKRNADQLSGAENSYEQVFNFPQIQINLLKG